MTDLRTAAAFSRYEQSADDAEYRASLEASVLAELIGDMREAIAAGGRIDVIVSDQNDAEEYHKGVDAAIRAAAKGRDAYAEFLIAELLDDMLLRAAKQKLAAAIDKRIEQERQEFALTEDEE